jgi:hypothetical protein
VSQKFIEFGQATTEFAVVGGVMAIVPMVRSEGAMIASAERTVSELTRERAWNVFSRRDTAGYAVSIQCKIHGKSGFRRAI